MRGHFAILSLFVAAGGLAQNPPDSTRKEAPPPRAPGTVEPIQIGGVTVSGSYRSRLYVWDWFEADSGDSSYAYSGSILRIGLSQKRERWDWNAEFAVPSALGLPANPFAPGTQGGLGMGANYLAANNRAQNTAMFFPKQLYVNLRKTGAPSALKIGRFEFADGGELAPKNGTLAALKNTRVNARLIGTFGFTDVGRSFDGFQYSYSTKASGNFTLMGVVPTRGVFQVDGWGWTRSAIGYGSYVRPWGKGAHAAETRLFAIYFDDFRRILKADNRPLAARSRDLANSRIGTFGGHSVHAVDTRRGGIDLLLWGAVQTGKWGVQDHLAHAIDVEAGFQPKVLPAVKPWLRGGFFDGSGDSNPNDNQHETFFQLVPTPRLFARFPFFNMMNNREVFGTLTLRPHTKVTVSSEFHALRLSNQNDLWYLGGGLFQPQTFGYTGRATAGRRSLANLYDTNLEYRMNPRTVLTGYFGYAQGLAVMETIYPRGKNGSFGYLELLYRF